MNDQWTDRLSEYLDGELAGGERTALEAHVATCAECRATLEELRRVVARARTLEDRTPRADLWPAINARLTPGRRPGVIQPWRLSLSVPQLLAASILLALLSGGGVWLGLHRPQLARDAQYTLRPGSPARPVVWTGRTDAAIAELQAVLSRNETRLDTATVRVVRENLAMIDVAIAQARAALAADPGDAYLNLHLADTMRRKLELLRRVNAIAVARS
ncbi:MAG TPA: zf-HC2 domain-containing protein [Gemmatimonadales bacterium]